jgi:hypothetical protein
MARRLWTLGAALLLSALSLAAPVTAQTGQIEYGTFTIASLDQNVQGGFFTFNGSQGDWVIVETVALSGTLNPRVTLLNAGSETLAVNSEDPFQPGIGDARLMYRLPATSSFTLLVEAEGGTAGQYLLRLERRDLPAPTPLGPDIITNANVSVEVPAQVYTFDSAIGTNIGFSTPTAGFRYAAEVYTAEGQLVSVHDGGSVTGNTTVPAATGVYTLVIQNLSTLSGTVEVTFGSGTPAAPQDTVQADAPPVEEAAPPPADTGDANNPPPVATPVPTQAPVTTEGDTDNGEGGEGDGNLGADTVGANIPTDRCTVTPSAGGVIVRDGPSTSFPAIASIPAGEFRFADATDGAWIRIVGNGWVSSGVVDLNGPCGGLPLVTVPTSPEGDAPPPEPTEVNPDPVGSR